jgi:glycerate kinase
MNILLAPDSFKDSLPATAVADYMAKGIRRVMPNAQITKLPLSDGGEGLLEALIEPLKGKYIEVEVKDPLNRNIKANYGILDKGKTAVIEMARASGLELLRPNERNPSITSTYGTGQLIKDALDKDCKKLIIGLGGSATNDGGMGLAKALGVKFLNIKGEQIEEGGGALGTLDRIDVSELDKRLTNCEIIAACDVTSPLTGKNGSSLIFGAQKGGDHKTLIQLDKNLSNYAKVIQQDLGKDIKNVKGVGAAGGTAMGLLAFLEAELKPGIDLIMKELQLETHLKQADLVITGEGQIDQQTLSGKTIAGLVKMAKQHQVSVIAIAGKVDQNLEDLYKLGLTATFSIVNQPMNLEEAIENTGQLVESCIENIFRIVIKTNIKKPY